MFGDITGFGGAVGAGCFGWVCLCDSSIHSFHFFCHLCRMMAVLLLVQSLRLFIFSLAFLFSSF